MEPSRRQHIEQIEIIERTVTESRRPLTSAEALNFQPQSSVRTSNEQFTTINAGTDPERRYQLTSERDAGRDSSLLYSPSGHQQSFGSIRDFVPLQQSTPERPTAAPTVVNQFGYDVHEVHTNEGGARVVETHGEGNLMLDRSMAETSNGQHQNQTSPPRGERAQQRSILKQPGAAEGGDTSWRKSPSSESSLARKDSYKRMQEAEEQQNASFYGQSSNATIVSKGSHQGTGAWAQMFGGKAEHGANGSFARMKDSFAEMSRQMREGECNMRSVACTLLCVLFVLVVLILLWLLISALFLSHSTFSFWLFPPPCEECQRRNPGAPSIQPPSRLYVHIYSPAQVHFELNGNAPFKSNSFTAVDFDTGYVAIADHALTDQQGRHITCFLMQLDLTALPDMSVLRDALENTYKEVHSQFGWQEYWQFNVEEVDASFVQGKFRDRIDDCQSAKWYFLKHTVYTRDSSCSYCYDFCLPDYAVLRRQKYEDELSLGVRRLNCFRLYVPEWAKFQVQADAGGGHWQYPMHTAQNTQRDSNGDWVNWQYGGGNGGAEMTRRKRRNETDA